MKNKDSICGIYGWFDRESRECLYIGKSIDIEERKSTHLKNLKSGRHPRKEFIEYYNRLNNKSNLLFETLEVLETTDEKELSIAECKWFFTLNPKFYGKMPSPDDHEWILKDEVKNSISNSLNKYFEENGNVCKTDGCNQKAFNVLFCKNCRKRNATECSYYVYDIEDEKIEDIIKQYREGVLPSIISEKLEIEINLIYIILYHFEISIDKQDTENPIEKIINQIENGNSIKNISEKFNLPIGKLNNFLFHYYKRKILEDESLEREIIKMYVEDKKSIIFISKELNIYPQSISLVLKNNNIENRTSPKEYSKEEILQLRESGLNLYEIAKKVGTSHITVRNVLMKSGHYKAKKNKQYKPLPKSKICISCKKDFKPRKRIQKYCSVDCRRK